MKTIKISDDVHKELKMFSVSKNINITPLVDTIILQGLEKRRHWFSKEFEILKSKTSNTKTK